MRDLHKADLFRFCNAAAAGSKPGRCRGQKNNKSPQMAGRKEAVMTAIKKYYTSEEVCKESGFDSTYYIGATADIKAMYKSIARKRNCGIYPRYCGSPKFSEMKSIYALCIDVNGQMTVINSDTFLAMVLAGEVSPA